MTAWVLIGSIIILGLMAPMVSDIISQVSGNYVSPVGFVMFLILPVLAFGLLYKLVFL